MSSETYYKASARQHGIYLFYLITKQTTTGKAFFIAKSFIMAQKPAFAHCKHEK